MKDNFYELSQDTIDDFLEVYDKKAFSVKINFEFRGAKKQKSLIKISKISDIYSSILEKDVMVIINEDLMNSFDNECIKILFEQELDKINIDIKTGNVKMIKPDLNTFASLIDKYGIDKISRANQVETLSVEQKEDVDSDFIV